MVTSRSWIIKWFTHKSQRVKRQVSRLHTRGMLNVMKEKKMSSRIAGESNLLGYFTMQVDLRLSRGFPFWKGKRLRRVN